MRQQQLERNGDQHGKLSVPDRIARVVFVSEEYFHAAIVAYCSAILLHLDAVEAIDGKIQTEDERNCHDHEVSGETEVRLACQQESQRIYHVADRIKRTDDTKELRNLIQRIQRARKEEHRQDD
jgi:hypothetical protein